MSNIKINFCFLILFSSFLLKSYANFHGILRKDLLKEFNELGEKLKLFVNRKVDNDNKMIIVNDRIEKLQKILTRLDREGEKFEGSDLRNSVTIIQGILFCATYLHSSLKNYFIGKIMN